MRSHLSLVLVLLAACGGDDVADSVDAAPERSIAGRWQVESGELFDLERQGVATIDYLEFEPASDGARSGVGELLASSPEGLSACTGLAYTELDFEAVNLSVPQLGPPDIRIIEHQSDDRVALTDASGNRVELTRIDELPTERRCVDATVAAEIALPVPMAPPSALTTDGVRLWFLGVDRLWQHYTPGTETFGPPFGPLDTLEGFINLHDFEAPDFWATSGAGRNARARLVNINSGLLIDEIDTEALMSPISIRSVASDGANLVLGGFDAVGGTRLLTVALDTKTIVANLQLGFAVRDIRFDGSDLWAFAGALGRAHLVQLDPVGQTVSQTVRLPDDVEITAFSFFEGRVFALAARDTERLLIEVNMP